MDFHRLGLTKELIEAIMELGYDTPTPIQKAVIPDILKGKNIYATAKTGSGKSAAFLLPLLQRLKRDKTKEHTKHPKALLLVPTRELAMQLEQSAKEYAKYLDIDIAALFGGANIGAQIKKIKGGVDLLVATPGRLGEALDMKSLALLKVKYLILDEADTMLDMGFFEDIVDILAQLPALRQKLLFSATHTGKVKHFAQQLFKNPKRIDIDAIGEGAKRLRQTAYLTDKEKKTELLAYLIGSRNFSQTLVFVSTRAEADTIAKEMELFGLKSGVIHGEKSHGARKKALERFKEGAIRVLVATDIAARGLDIPTLPCVINFDMPQAPEDYIHRVGRTGRAGRSGEAISLLSVDEDAMLREIERLLKQKIEKLQIEDFKREIVHLKMDKRLHVKKPPVKGAFGKKMKKNVTTKKRKRTKRDI